MSQLQELLKSYSADLRHPEVSGFELLDLLEKRSALAELEDQLDDVARRQLEVADALFMEQAETLYRGISAVASLSEIRSRSRVSPSHWWWYLDRWAEYMKVLVP